MYESYYQLHSNPFVPNPLPEFIFEGKEHREALAHFEYALTRFEPFVLLTGEVGTGKTTAVQALRRRLPPEFSLAVISHTTLNPREFLEALLLRFGLQAEPGEGKAVLIERLERFLIERRRTGARVLLVVDEAHLLSTAVLEEVRLFSNLEEEGAKLLQICLVAQPELEAHLLKPELRQLRQRISVRYTLRPLNREETGAYIRHRLEAAGARDADRLFPPEAVATLHGLTQGLPREINIVAGQALLNAYLEGADGVLPAHVYSTRSDYGFQGITSPGGERARGPAPPPRIVPRSQPPRRPQPGPGIEPPNAAVPPPPLPIERPGLVAPASPRIDPPAPPAPPPPFPIERPGPPVPRDPVTPTSRQPASPPAKKKAPRPIPLPPPSLRPEAAGALTSDPVVPEAAVAATTSVAGKPDSLLDRPRPPRRLDRKDTSGRWVAGSVVGTLLILAALFYFWGETPSGGADPLQAGTRAASSPVKQTASAGTQGRGAVDGLTGQSAGGAEIAASQSPGSPPPVSPTPPAMIPGRFTIQVASFRTREGAEAAQDLLQARTGLPGLVIPRLPEAASWYKLYLGAFPGSDEARAAAAPLLEDGTIEEILVRVIPGGRPAASRTEAP